MTPDERYGRGAARFYRLAIDPIVRPLRLRIAARLCRGEPGAVLDVACATGAQARLLARCDLSVVGLDLSPAMVAAAAERCPSVPFVCASALALPFPDEAFDAVILSLALHEHPEDERRTMVREALRVLRCGGELLIADFAEPRNPRSNLPWRVIRAIEGASGVEHRTGFADFVAQASLRGLLGRLGLEASSIERSHFGCIEIAAIAKPQRV